MGTLTGIIADWSAQQINGLINVIGKPIADNILKGCQVHFIRSVQRVTKCVNPWNNAGRDTFIMIGKEILKSESAETILMLFEVLRGNDIKSKGSNT
uniref:Uncharacterized protein n=1 Tax=Amphimedon queenslandica TaxID=400682 RepID=A0A1X7U9R5_AMPQE